MGWHLSDIRAKVRAITGRPSPDQISDSDLNTYINNYYAFTMPFELKEQIMNAPIKFITIPGVDFYSFPTGYFTDSPMAYADGFPLTFYEDRDIFYQDWPQQYAINNLATGDGIANSFSGSLQKPPIIMGSLFIASDDSAGNYQVISDDGAGNLVGDGSGTIQYVTGAFTATFNTVPALNATIYGKYIGYTPTRPQGVLFSENAFTFRPVPDQAYQIQMNGFAKPALLLTNSSIPLQEEWGPLIAYGAAVELFSDTGDLENYDRYYALMKRQENIALGRTVEQLSSQQSVPRW